MSKNYNKYLSGIGILLIGIGVFYYFLIFVPNKEEANQIREKNQQNLKNQIECSKLGKIKLKEINDNMFVSAINDEYNYNTQDNNCYLYYRDIFYFKEDKDWSINRYIVDIYTNETVAQVNYMGKEKEKEEVDSFEKDYNKYMNN